MTTAAPLDVDATVSIERATGRPPLTDRPDEQVWTRTLVGLGLALVGAAAAWTLALSIGNLGGYHWADEALVPTDGRAHEVTVTAGETTRMWTAMTQMPGCRVADTASGDRIALASSQEYTRPAGSIGSWIAGAEFVPTSDTVTVACASTGTDVVAVGAGGGTWLVDTTSDAMRAPVSLAVLGAGLLVAAMVLGLARHQGTPPAPGSRR
ncbi:hypothetical protein [Nocardioides sp. GY 10127]|uniref:hypothetical protein n=1 Tax=Nocardioides sp. GY 10127 TaxID=2569762 RepID=UPI0010A8A317|nr:hypothetical protein [Nocardioides sp. GY 10127]TIC81797.1 hypothetical protein E8D37_11495 [Nocardioides sp. GY 10127]